MNFSIYFLLSFFLIYLNLNLFLKYSRNILLDNPNSRSSHTKPTPSGAGIIFSSLITLNSIFFNKSNLFIAYPLSLVGFVDDKFKIPSQIRYLAQFITSFFILKNSEFINNSLISNNLFFCLIFLTIVGTAIINFTNFLDCLDGLISSCFLIIFFTISLESGNNYFIAISLFSFLFYNWHPAKLFMGDSGSTYLGAIYFSLILQSNTIEVFLSKLLLASPIFLDAISCLIIRFKNGFNIFKAHRMHLAQRLYLSGWSHSKVSVLYVSLTVIMSGLYHFGNLSLMLLFTLILCLAGAYINRKYASAFPIK